MKKSNTFSESKDTEVYLVPGNEFFNKADTLKAIENFDKAIKINTQHAKTYYSRRCDETFLKRYFLQ